MLIALLFHPIYSGHLRRRKGCSAKICHAWFQLFPISSEYYRVHLGVYLNLPNWLRASQNHRLKLVEVSPLGIVRMWEALWSLLPILAGSTYPGCQAQSISSPTWRCQELNLIPFVYKADSLPLSHSPLRQLGRCRKWPSKLIAPKFLGEAMVVKHLNRQCRHVI